MIDDELSEKLIKVIQNPGKLYTKLNKTIHTPQSRIGAHWTQYLTQFYHNCEYPILLKYFCTFKAFPFIYVYTKIRTFECNYFYKNSY